jgi:hypothetical protein
VSAAALAPFDPFAAGLATEDTGKGFDPFADGSAEPTRDWATMFAGRDGLLSLNESDRAAYRLLAENTDNTPDDKARALNQAYVGSKLGMAGAQLEADWPATKLAFAQTALGWRDGDISDTKFAELVGQK